MSRRWLGLLPLLCLGCSAAEHPVADAAAFRAAAKAVQPGDALVLAAGEWRDADLLITARGTAAQPIQIRAAQPGAVVLSGSSRLRLGGAHLVASGLLFRGPGEQSAVDFRADSKTLAENCRLTDCAIVDYSPASKTKDTKWINLYGRQNRVDHCYLAGKTNNGATLVVWVGEQPGRHQIDHNHFGPRPKLGVNGGETIRVGTSDVSLRDELTVVEDNLFTECNGEVEIISSKSCGNLYRRNTFRRCQGALTLRHGNRCRVEGNWFLGDNQPLTGGVRVIGVDHQVLGNYFGDLAGTGSRGALTVMQGFADSPLSGYLQPQRILLAHNTIAHCVQPLYLGLPGDLDGRPTTLPPVGLRLLNNLIGGADKLLVTVSAPPPEATWAGNLAFGGPLGHEVAGMRLGDSPLQRAADGLWRPTASPPAAAGERPEHDIDGQPYPDQPVVGCDQPSTAAASSRPATVAEAGPAWFGAR
ncbi:MAG: polysaccharide lyase 6 family protein [Fimbriimonadaceae bacterium]|nr:polysaccharide lyase 6 family protein [Fimbriimonadaceae bacterium]